MPANLPPKYFELEKRYREARAVSEKPKYLEEMLAIMPKHKAPTSSRPISRISHCTVRS